uniref:Uncharacterized protein n=1 Tax=Pithovirus LCPAC304 TaxID=2506594 RepID=A0A481Z8X9_9VIRU|nr:MAG: hypothetical protein LCPAC304_06950 [Pithovirus LCPAC304]
MGPKTLDIDIFVPVVKDSRKKEWDYAYHNYTTLEEFLFYHCRIWDSPKEQENHYEDCEAYRTSDDIPKVRDYLVDGTTKTPFPAIYEALNLGDAQTVKKLVRSLSPTILPTVRWQEARMRTFIGTEDVVAEDFRWICARCISWRWPDDVDIIPAATRFQVIHKSCTSKQLLDNIYHTFDFDFCKVVCRVDENGRFRTQANDWSSVFAKKCTFPKKLPYKNCAVPTTIQRYFKYLKRGFTFTSVDHNSMLKALTTLWSSKYHPCPLPEFETFITTETSMEAVKCEYLWVLKSLEHQLWYRSDKDECSLLIAALNKL